MSVVIHHTSKSEICQINEVRNEQKFNFYECKTRHRRRSLAAIARISKIQWGH